MASAQGLSRRNKAARPAVRAATLGSWPVSTAWSRQASRLARSARAQASARPASPSSGTANSVVETAVGATAGVHARQEHRTDASAGTPSGDDPAGSSDRNTASPGLQPATQRNRCRPIRGAPANSPAGALRRPASPQVPGPGRFAGAKAAWRQAIETQSGLWADGAFLDLLNQLCEDGDLDGARAAHRIGIETGNPETPHALVVIGKMLRAQGDLDGWRAAWQQAIDTGYDDADTLRKFLSAARE